MNNMEKGELQNSVFLGKFCYHNKSNQHFTQKFPTVLESLKIFVKENYSSSNKGLGSKSRSD